MTPRVTRTVGGLGAGVRLRCKKLCSLVIQDSSPTPWILSDLGCQPRGLDECLTEAFQIATDGCSGVFLSVDVDVVDPGSAPGTGTPEPGGLTSRQLLDAVRRTAMELPVVGLDVVEVSPPYDHAEVTAYLGNRVVLEALAGLAWRRRNQTGESPRRPADPLLGGRGPESG